MGESARPRVAAVVTEYRPMSHADVIVGRLLEGYTLHGDRVEPRLEVASLYLDQVPANDIGRELAAKHGIPIFETIGEAMTLGGKGVAVDGVLLIGEHGNYPLNARGQILYPRRRFFDAAVAAMVAGGRIVPVFVDKHLSWSFDYARYMYDTAQRLGIPLLAGSSVPLAWRSPAGDWPLGAPLTEAVAVGYGPPEAYEFHTLEGLQSIVERRAGGETGVRAVHDLPRAEIWRAEKDGRWSGDLLMAALATLGLTGEQADQALGALKHLILVEYRDGLRAAVCLFDAYVRDFAVAARGGDHSQAHRLALEPGRPFGHFSFLIRQIETLVLTGTPPYPAARTLLTTGILDVAMRSRTAGGVRIETPELAIAYQPADNIADTAINVEPPFLQAAGSGR